MIQRHTPVMTPVVMWFGKALAASSIDTLIDFAMATMTGMPPPGFWAHIGNFFVVLIPGLRGAKKVKRAAKLLKVIDNLIESVENLNRLRIPGAGRLLKRMTVEADQFKDAIGAAHLFRAKEALGRLLGFLREAQIASHLKEGGATMVHLGKELKVGKTIVTEVDLITEEAGNVVLNQVKAGKRAVLTPGSTAWGAFTRQIDETVKAAAALGAQVRYSVDDISDEARTYLTDRGVHIRKTSDILKEGA